MLPLRATDPAFTGQLNILYRLSGYRIAATCHQYLVEDDIVEKFKILLLEFPCELSGA